MVKKILALLICCFVLYGDELKDSIQNFIGEEAYYTNQNFIKRLFKEEKKFYTDHGVDYFLVLKTLKDNGLLELSFSQPSELNITIKAKSKPIFLTKMINQTLSAIGYSYFTISKARYNRGEVELKFSFVTEHLLDPVIFVNELKKRGIFPTRIQRTGDLHWEYDLAIEHWVVLNATPLKEAQRLELKNISGEYWFDVKQAGLLQIQKKNPRIGWFPRIVLYDKNLEILEIITQNSFALESEIPLNEQTAFVMVTDLNNPARLKYGITVIFTPF